MIVVYYLDDSGSKFAYDFRSPMGLDLVRCFCFAEALMSFLRKRPRERRADKSRGQKEKAFHSACAVCRACYFFWGVQLARRIRRVTFPKSSWKSLDVHWNRVSAAHCFWHRMPLVRFCADRPLTIDRQMTLRVQQRRKAWMHHWWETHEAFLISGLGKRCMSFSEELCTQFSSEFVMFIYSRCSLFWRSFGLFE